MNGLAIMVLWYRNQRRRIFSAARKVVVSTTFYVGYIYRRRNVSVDSIPPIRQILKF